MKWFTGKEESHLSDSVNEVCDLKHRYYVHIQVIVITEKASPPLTSDLPPTIVSPTVQNTHVASSMMDCLMHKMATIE